MMSQQLSDIRPLHISTYDRGGAAIASLRLHHELLRQGITSQYRVFQKTTDSETIDLITDKMLTPEKQWLKRVYKQNLFLDRQAITSGAIKWSDNRRWQTVPFRLNQFDADLIHLNWIGDGLLPVGLMRFINKPLIWTMHDSWGYTGGCHVPLDCDRFYRGCGQCPQLQSDDPDDASQQGYALKHRTWRNLNLTVVTPSEWLAQRFRDSPIYQFHRIDVIPNGLDLSSITVRDKDDARRILNLDADGKYVLFGAVSIRDYNKGGDLIAEALHHLPADEPVHVIVTGRDYIDFDFPENINVIQPGYITDVNRLNLYYAAADVCVVPSRQENLNNTIMEALASGTPAVAFDVGGNGELIRHQEHGYLAIPYDTEQLAQGIQWAMMQDRSVSRIARRYVESHYDIHRIAEQYLALYQDVIRTT